MNTILKRIMFFMIMVSLLLTACGSPSQATSVPTTDAGTVHTERFDTLVEACINSGGVPEGNVISGEVRCLLAPVVGQTELPPIVEIETSQSAVPMITNDLVNPVLHHADSQPPENGVGSFDVGVKQGQIGLAFGWHIAWPKGNLDAGGEGCDLVILTPGWYENLQVTDGRYEVYDVPFSDYPGWVKVLGQQRADEQAKDYGCTARSFQDLPQWESPIPSPP